MTVQGFQAAGEMLLRVSACRKTHDGLCEVLHQANKRNLYLGLSSDIDYCFDPADISGGGNYVQVGRGNDRQLRGGD